MKSRKSQFLSDSKALRMFAEELTGFLSYFPREDTLFVLDEPNRLNERMELILYEYTESMKNRLEGGYILPGQMRDMNMTGMPQ